MAKRRGKQYENARIRPIDPFACLLARSYPQEFSWFKKVPWHSAFLGLTVARAASILSLWYSMTPPESLQRIVFSLKGIGNV
jgi:hypothetical protein